MGQTNTNLAYYCPFFLCGQIGSTCCYPRLQGNWVPTTFIRERVNDSTDVCGKGSPDICWTMFEMLFNGPEVVDFSHVFRRGQVGKGSDDSMGVEAEVDARTDATDLQRPQGIFKNSTDGEGLNGW